MNIQVNISEYEVLGSGTVIGIDDKPIVFRVQDLIFKLVFFNDDKTNAYRLEAEPEGEKTLIIKFFNFNNPMGVGNHDPLLTGWLDVTRKIGLYFSYRVYHIESISKTLHYTWYKKTVSQ